MSKLDARRAESANERIDDPTNEAGHFCNAYGIATPAMTVAQRVHLPSRRARTRV
jgi:hypothetical protein